jgi:hypothetical protein
MSNICDVQQIPKAVNAVNDCLIDSILVEGGNVLRETNLLQNVINTACWHSLGSQCHLAALYCSLQCLRSGVSVCVTKEKKIGQKSRTRMKRDMTHGYCQPQLAKRGLVPLAKPERQICGLFFLGGKARAAAG